LIAGFVFGVFVLLKIKNKIKNMKTEKNVFVRLLTAVCVSAFLGGVFAAPAQVAFPQDQAGIAAYVKLEGVNLESFENAKKTLFELPESVGGNVYDWK